nr:MAG TPA: hypothetical protein [Caudoviricetes sp.]
MESSWTFYLSHLCVARLYLHHIFYYQIYNASHFHIFLYVLYSLLHIDISSILCFR